MDKKRSGEHEIRYGSCWKPTSVRPRGVSPILMRARVAFLFFPQFPITALCPHHMSFTSNYRKLRVSPNARIKARAGCYCFQVRRAVAKEAEGSRKQGAKNGVTEKGQDAQYLRVRQWSRTPEEAKEVIRSVTPIGSTHCKQDANTVCDSHLVNTYSHCFITCRTTF